MKTLGIMSFILFSAAVAGISFNGCGGKATGADGTVVVEFEWNGKHHITLEELQQEISELPEYKQPQYQDKAGLEEYINLMAESRLILFLAKEKKLDEDPEILKNVQEYFHELMIDRITGQEVDRKLKLTEEDYRLYYEENKSDYIEAEQVRLTCITLADEERANEIFQRIKNGEDIKKVAKELSDGEELTAGPAANPKNPGDTGFFSHSAYAARAKAFANAAFALEVGQMAEEILSIEIREVQYYMIFRKEEHKEARQRTLEEDRVRRNVESGAERQKRENLMNEWLMRLHERAKVQTFPDRIPETPKAEEESEGEPPATDDSAPQPESDEGKPEEP